MLGHSLTERWMSLRGKIMMNIADVELPERRILMSRLMGTPI